MKIKSLIAFIVSVFLVSTLFGTVTTSLINYSQFTEVFDYANSKPQTAENLTPVWYVQYQAGDDINTVSQSHQLETGDLNGFVDEADFNWSYSESYSYSVTIDGAGNIESAFETATVADTQIGAFNKIYFGLYVSKDEGGENIEIVHTYDGGTISGLVGDRSLPNHFVGFALEDSGKPINIADFDLQGQITLNMYENTVNEEWTYTIIGVNSVPEPATYALLIGVISLAAVMRKRR